MAARARTKLSSDDLAVQATNDDATSCKRCVHHLKACMQNAKMIKKSVVLKRLQTLFGRYAVDRGYWSDEFIKHFYRSSERRSPEISRG